MARAVARLNILDELCLPLVKKNGYFLSLKGRQAPEEVKEAKKGIQLLGGQIESTHDFTLANHDDFRSNIIIKKVKEHQTGRYIYRYCRSDCTSGEDAEIYELVVGREESYFYDVRKFRFYTFMEETKK